MTDNTHKASGTLRTYLGSILCFFDFCENNNESIVSLPKIQWMGTVIRKWRRTLQKKIDIRAHEKNLNDLAKLPMPEDMILFDKSALVESSKSVLMYLRCRKFNVQKLEFCRIRDYLMTVLIIDNASRSGAIANMTLEEYHRVKVVQVGYINTS